MPYNVSGYYVKNYTYDVFGNVTASGSFINETQFTGAISDSNTGLLYMNARYYNSNTGRFKVACTSSTGAKTATRVQHTSLGHRICIVIAVIIRWHRRAVNTKCLRPAPVNMIDPTGYVPNFNYGMTDSGGGNASVVPVPAVHNGDPEGADGTNGGSWNDGSNGNIHPIDLITLPSSIVGTIGEITDTNYYKLANGIMDAAYIVYTIDGAYKNMLEGKTAVTANMVNIGVSYYNYKNGLPTKPYTYWPMRNSESDENFVILSVQTYLTFESYVPESAGLYWDELNDEQKAGWENYFLVAGQMERYEYNELWQIAGQLTSDMIHAIYFQ